MNTKFTKGPWKTDAEYGQFWNISSVAGAPIALASAPIALVHPDWQIERTANAALIASAPELYEALESLSNIAALLKLTYPGAHGPVQKFIDAADAALKKARGEA